MVGSAICKEISKSIEKRQNAVTNVTNIVKRLKNKIQIAVAKGKKLYDKRNVKRKRFYELDN